MLIDFNIISGITCFSLGALTVIHPCPLTTNIAGISLLYGWKQEDKKWPLLAVSFVSGEIVTFVLLAILISMGFLNLPIVANFLQAYLGQLLGPFLIIAGMMFSGILLPGRKGIKIYDRFKISESRSRVPGSFLLGVLIALSFCPLSAAVFFGVLIPLAIKDNSLILYPVFFGAGTAIPLLLIVIFISRSVFLLNRSFLVKKSAENFIKKITGIFMILWGIFICLRFIFKIL